MQHGRAADPTMWQLPGGGSKTKIWRFRLSPNHNSSDNDRSDAEPHQEELVLYLLKDAINLAGVAGDKAASKMSLGVHNTPLLHA